MSAYVKKILTWAVVAFVAFYLFTLPEGGGGHEVVSLLAGSSSFAELLALRVP